MSLPEHVRYRFNHDAPFNMLVHSMLDLMERNGITQSDIAYAAMVAADVLMERRIREAMDVQPVSGPRFVKPKEPLTTDGGPS